MDGGPFAGGGGGGGHLSGFPATFISPEPRGDIIGSAVRFDLPPPNDLGRRSPALRKMKKKNAWK